MRILDTFVLFTVIAVVSIPAISPAQETEFERGFISPESQLRVFSGSEVGELLKRTRYNGLGLVTARKLESEIGKNSIGDLCVWRLDRYANTLRLNSEQLKQASTGLAARREDRITTTSRAYLSLVGLAGKELELAFDTALQQARSREQESEAILLDLFDELLTPDAEARLVSELLRNHRNALGSVNFLAKYFGLTQAQRKLFLNADLALRDYTREMSQTASASEKTKKEYIQKTRSAAAGLNERQLQMYWTAIGLLTEGEDLKSYVARQDGDRRVFLEKSFPVLMNTRSLGPESTAP